MICRRENETYIVKWVRKTDSDIVKEEKWKRESRGRIKGKKQLKLNTEQEVMRDDSGL